MDSLQCLLQNSKSDTTKLRLYLELGDACDIKDNLKYALPAENLADKLLSKSKDAVERKRIATQGILASALALYYYQQKGDTASELLCLEKELSISLEVNEMKYIMTSMNNILEYYNTQENIPLALECCQNACLFFQKNNYKEGTASFLFNLGNIYFRQDDSVQSLYNFQKSLTLYEEIKDTTKIADAFSNLGYVYGQFHNVPKAMENFNQAIRLMDHVNLADRFSKVLYHRIGRMYLENGDLLNAQINVEKCLSLAEHAANPFDWVPVCLDDLGDIYFQTDLDKSIQFHLKALEAGEKMNSQIRVAHSNSCLSLAYFNKKDFIKADHYNSLFLSFVKLSFEAYSIGEAEHLAAKIDSASGNFKDAYVHFQQYIIYRDKLNSEEVRKAATKEKFQNQYDNQKAIDKKEQEKKDAIAGEEKHKQNIITTTIAGGLFLVLIFLGIIFRSLRITRKQKEEIDFKRKETEEQKKIIEEKNKDILDSIHYAKRIQNSLLPTEKYIFRNIERLKKK